jgi:C4-type Zn-finger protein
MVAPVRVLRRVIDLVQSNPEADYSADTGMKCPACGGQLNNRMGVRRTCAWEGNSRERYHSCPFCGLRFKSVETLKA